MPGIRLSTLRRRRGPSDRGAAAVEFALVFPLVLVLTFGIIEFAQLLRDYVGVSQVVRDSVRTASAAPQKGATGSLTNIRAGHAGTASPTSFAYDASQVLASTGTAIPKSSIVDLWVYLANAKGFPLAAGTAPSAWRTDTSSSFTSCPVATCVRYAWEPDPDGTGPLEATFDYRSGDWNPASINACAGKPEAMAVGVFMRVRHNGPLSSLFGTGFDVSDSSVLKFEPLRNVNCQGT